MTHLGKIPILTFILILSMSLTSCDGGDELDGMSEEEINNCNHYAGKDLETFFDQGDYSFSCMDDHGAVTIKYPVIADNHRIIPSSDAAVNYIMAVNYFDTAVDADNNFEFAKIYAENIIDDQQNEGMEVTSLGDEAYFYIIVDGDETTHYIVYRDCNFVGSISGEYRTGDDLPCNLGINNLVAYAQEVLKNI